MYSGSSDGEGHEAAQRKIPPASSMLWVRNLRRFIGSGTGLGSEALMGILPHTFLSLISMLFIPIFVLSLLSNIVFLGMPSSMYVCVYVWIDIDIEQCLTHLGSVFWSI